MSLNQSMKLTNAELNALLIGNEITDSQDAARNAMYKMCANIARKRQTFGFSEADIFEGLAEGCDATDVSYYTFTVLEYVSRYTSKYGAAVLIILGIYQALQTASAIGSALFSLIFGSAGDKSKDMYKKDAMVRRDWLTSGADPAALIGGLIDGMCGMLPPGLKTVIEKYGKVSPASSATSSALSTAGSALAAGAAAAIPGASTASTLLQAALTALTGAVQDGTVRDATVRDARVRDAKHGIRAGNMGIARRRI